MTTEAEDRAEALHYVAVAILREMAADRGKGPWFPGLMSRLQRDLAWTEIRKGKPDDAPNPKGEAVYKVFVEVLGDETVPDFRHDAALSGSTVNPLLYPAVVAAQRLAIQVLVDAVREGPDGQERLRLSRVEAIRQAEVQSVPGDAKGVLKDRWIGASIAVIEAAFESDQ